MKLYYYEHCPFSARARMMLNLGGIDAEREVVLADDEQTIPRLVGRHTVPVLVKGDGEALADSMAIVCYLNRLGGKPLLDERQSPAVAAWAEAAAPAMQYLGYPRWYAMELKELATPAAKARFREKKQESIGDFAEALAGSRTKIAEVEIRLGELAQQVKLDARRDRLSFDDILGFAALRGFTVVKDLHWPAAVRRYVEEMSERCGVETFFDRAR